LSFYSWFEPWTRRVVDVAKELRDVNDETCLRDTVKLERAHGGCLGVERRRRTWIAAKSSGKLRTSVEPEISESGNRMR
jgi:hypothetical protein